MKAHVLRGHFKRPQSEQWIRKEIEENLIFAKYVRIQVGVHNPRIIADSREMTIDEMVEATRSLPVFSIHCCNGDDEKMDIILTEN